MNKMKDKSEPTSIISETTLPGVIPSNIEDEMQKAYIDYSMNVIVGRALPDVRDGLKPVHRRILYAMNDQRMTHDKAYKKSARIVGEVLGKYHPHGDCLRGDTKLFLANGTFSTIKELFDNKESCDIICISENGKPHVAEAHSFRIGQYTYEIFQIELNDGSKIECTSNHPFLSSSLEWITAERLRVGTNLFFSAIKTGKNKIPKINITVTEKTKLFVTKINILHVDIEPMYDFTVDKYENMLIPVNSIGDQHNMICVHNSSVYDALVRMVQTFSLRYPLIDGQGNFGSSEDDPAAMRYTEARLGKISDEILEDINKNTVKFIPNYDGSLEEPSVLPCKLPNLLINGSTGIAVGMATNMPPHNLGEVVDGIIAVIDNPSLESTALMEYIKGPDFPTAAVIYGKSGIYKAYTTGRGSVKIRAVVDTETSGTREQLIVTELPYQVNKANLIETIADLVKDKKIVGISNIRDESDKDGIRIVIELSKQAYPKVVLNKLFSSTNLETSFSIINLALVDGKPKVMALKELISNYISHRKEIIIKRSEFDLDKAKQRGHILEGLNIAISKIDTVISALKIAKSTHDAQIKLVEKLEVSTKQAKAILDMKLHKITRLEHDNIDKEYKEIETTISKLKELLSDEKNVLNVIKSELLYLKEKFSNERRTKIVEDTGDFSTEDLIPKVNNVIMITKTGYIKRLEVDSYRQQRRGGKGVLGMDTKEEDIVSDVFIANSHEYIMFFTDMGKVYWLKVYSIPSLTKQAKGTAIINIVQLEKDEQITAYIPVKKFDDKHFLVMVTKNGTIKKVNLDKFSHPRTTGIYAISLDEGDKLISVKLTNGNDHILIGTKHGQAIRFKESILRPTGRTAYGVIGMKLHGKDKVISMDIVKKGCSLLTVSENGYGKRTNFSEYRVTNRGGTGIITINTDERNGNVVDIRSVKEDDEIIVSTASGITIRVPVKGITLQGRATSGVRIMRVDKGDKVVGVAPLAKESDINMKE